jgi:hypothetical protein
LGTPSSSSAALGFLFTEVGFSSNSCENSGQGCIIQLPLSFDS